MEFIFRNPHIFVLCGKSSSGKDTAFDFFKDIYENKGKKIIGISYASYLKIYASNVLGWNKDDEDSKPRDFLQQIGVELIKNKINPRLVLDRILDDIRVYSYFYDVIVITDARFTDEIEEVRSNFDKVSVVKVYRDNNSKLSEIEKNHLTEVSLDGYNNFDYVVSNNGSFLELEEKINNIVSEVDVYE